MYRAKRLSNDVIGRSCKGTGALKEEIRRYLRTVPEVVSAVDIEDTAIVREDSMLAGMIEKEISEEVEKMLECLKPLDRELFMKLYVEDKTIEQVSEETGMKKEIIYNRLSRGKNKIRRQYRTERGVSYGK